MPRLKNKFNSPYKYVLKVLGNLKFSFFDQLTSVFPGKIDILVIKTMPRLYIIH